MCGITGFLALTGAGAPPEPSVTAMMDAIAHRGPDSRGHWCDADAGIALGNVGRFGHGLGKILTEPPSNKPGDKTRLEPGVVLTIEPNALFGKGKILVHEENIVVTPDGAELLSRRAPREMVVIDA